MVNYARLCKTTIGSGRLVPLELIENADTLNNELLSSPKSDWYTSLFYFRDDSKKYFVQNNNSIGGYKGTAYSKKLAFDFDSEQDVQKAKDDAIELIKRLEADGVDVYKHVIVYFSGSKGFHVEMPMSKELTSKEIENICINLAEGLPTFDKVIYNTTRLYRLPYTKHNKSGLYKIPLSLNNFNDWDIERIKKEAESFTRNSFYPISVVNLSFLDKYKVIKLPTKAAKTKFNNTSTDNIRGLNEIDFSNCPRTIPRCIYALQQGIMKPGERNAVMLRLAAYFKNQGMDKKVVHRTLKGIAELNKELYPEADVITKDEIWNTVIASVFSVNSDWKQVPGSAGVSEDNDLIKSYCEAIKVGRKCCLHGRNNKQSTIKIEDVSNSFENFAANFDKNIVKTGLNVIDDNMKITVGTTTLLVGAPGSGKTTLALNIMEKANALGQHTMFFSLDMHKNLIYLKLAQKLTNYTQDQILNFYKSKDQEKIKTIREKISKTYGKTFFDFSSTLTVEQMRDKVQAIQDRHEVDIKFVVVDYASRVSGQFSDTYANARYNALASTGVADETNAAWIYICQVSRNAGDGSTPLRTKRAAKESGDWEETATNVITCWRPFMGNPDEDDVIRIFLAKNRMGKELEMPLHWDGAKGMIRDMSDDELAEYKENREPAEKEKTKSRFS